MIAERIRIAPVKTARPAVDEAVCWTIEPMMSTLACATPAVRRGLIGLLLRAAAAGDTRPGA